MFFPDDGEKMQIKKLAEGHFRNLLYKFFRRQDFSKQTFLYRFVKDQFVNSWQTFFAEILLSHKNRVQPSIQHLEGLHKEVKKEKQSTYSATILSFTCFWQPFQLLDDSTLCTVPIGIVRDPEIKDSKHELELSKYFSSNVKIKRENVVKATTFCLLSLNFGL